MKIPQLEDLTFGQRFLLTLIIVLAILFGLALFGYLGGRWDDATAAPAKEVDFYQGLETDKKLLQLDKEALDEAYRRHMIRLWDVWLSDGARSADRISNGTRIARNSYHHVSGQIAKREQEQSK